MLQVIFVVVMVLWLVLGIVGPSIRARAFDGVGDVCAFIAVLCLGIKAFGWM